jgi:integrase
VTADRIPAGVPVQSVSRFGAPKWNMSMLQSDAHAAAVVVAWDRYDDPRLCSSMRRAGWCLINLPTPGELLERKATSRVLWRSPSTIYGYLTQLRGFANWLTSKGIGLLAEVTAEDLEDYAAHIRDGGSDTATQILYAISLLWGYSPHLPAGDRIPMPPWEAGDLDDFLPERGIRNTTPPIHPAVMSPLLIWALRFVEDFSGDIIAGWQERQRLQSQVPREPSWAAVLRVRAFVEQCITSGRPLPGTTYRGRLSVADSYLAGLLRAPRTQVHDVAHYRRGQYTISGQTPLDIKVTGQLQGQPWQPFLDYYHVPFLMRQLSTACMIIIGYLSGMRVGEVLGLKAGCCPEPGDDGQATVRYQIYGNVLKGVRDEHGRRVQDGRPRDLPWTVIMPVVRAIRVLEQLADGDDLFPASTAWSNAPGGQEKMRAGHLLTAGAAGHRVRSFIGYANQLATQHRLACERIPDDPDGHVTLKRFRRTIAWHIARLPGGRIALATQYGHLRASTVTDGYSGRARHGLRRVLDVETARAMADYLDDLAERIDQGEGVSGPAAQRMIKAAQETRIRFEGTFLSPKMAEALLDEPRFNVYDNPEAFLTCNNDPAKALCHIGRAGQANRSRPPAVDRCDPPAPTSPAPTPTSSSCAARSPGSVRRSPALSLPPRCEYVLASASPSCRTSPIATSEPGSSSPRTHPRRRTASDRQGRTRGHQRRDATPAGWQAAALLGRPDHRRPRRRGRTEAQQAHPQAHRPQGPVLRRDQSPQRHPRQRTEAPRRDRHPQSTRQGPSGGTRHLPHRQRRLRPRDQRPHRGERRTPKAADYTTVLRRHPASHPAVTAAPSSSFMSPRVGDGAEEDLYRQP